MIQEQKPAVDSSGLLSVCPSMEAKPQTDEVSIMRLERYYQN
ncbi:MAG TPA: hypothetical protein VFA68_13740 [Terriglobales bacterium]|nr:hypothetical protein [Terriglobales bacterium]